MEPRARKFVSISSRFVGMEPILSKGGYTSVLAKQERLRISDLPVPNQGLSGALTIQPFNGHGGRVCVVHKHSELFHLNISLLDVCRDVLVQLQR